MATYHNNDRLKEITNKKNNKEEMLNKKKSLQQQFVRQVGTKDSVEPEQNQEKSQIDIQDIEKLNNKIKELKKQLKNVSSSKEQALKNLNNTKIDLKKLKDNNQKLMNTISELNLNHDKNIGIIDNLKNQLSMKDSLINELKQEIDSYQEDNLLKELEQIKIQNSELKNRNRKLTITLGLRNEELKKYKSSSSVAGYYQEEIKKQQSKHSELRQRYIKLRADYSNALSRNENLTEIIMSKEPSMRLKFVEYFKNVFYEYKKNKFIKKKINEKNKPKVKNLIQNEEVKYGYLSIDINDNLVFLDIEGNEHQIEYFKAISNISVDMPAKATIASTGLATIIQVYTNATACISDKTDKTNSREKSNKVIKKVAEAELDEQVIPFKNEHVLIIGSRFKRKYILELTKLGLTISWFNPFEDNLKKLDAICDKVDIVIVCKSHISHAVSNILKKYEGNIKYQYMTKDSVKNIVARIRFVLASQDKL